MLKNFDYDVIGSQRVASHFYQFKFNYYYRSIYVHFSFQYLINFKNVRALNDSERDNMQTKNNEEGKA